MRDIIPLTAGFKEENRVSYDINTPSGGVMMQGWEDFYEKNVEKVSKIM